MTHDQAVRICELLWDQLPDDPEDAWSVLAMILGRFVKETDETSRAALIGWLNHDRPVLH